MLTLVWILMFCASVLSLDDKYANRTKAGQMQLGLSLDDPRVINRGAVCPPDCPRDCKELYDQGNEIDGPFIIYVSTDSMRPLLVYCDMETSGGGWTIFQRRFNGAEDFYRDWVDYVDGFGQITSEYWLGLQNLHLLLAQKNYKLRVDLTDFNGSTPYAEYKLFTIGSPLNKYSLGINMFLGGAAGDALKYGSGNPSFVDTTNSQFTTRDQDNDLDQSPATNCAVYGSGAWWYNSCGAANLNGVYTSNTTGNIKYNHWWTWRNGHYAMKSSEMKFRPM